MSLLRHQKFKLEDGNMQRQTFLKPNNEEPGKMLNLNSHYLNKHMIKSRISRFDATPLDRGLNVDCKNFVRDYRMNQSPFSPRQQLSDMLKEGIHQKIMNYETRSFVGMDKQDHRPQSLNLLEQRNHVSKITYNALNVTSKLEEFALNFKVFPEKYKQPTINQRQNQVNSYLIANLSKSPHPEVVRKNNFQLFNNTQSGEKTSINIKNSNLLIANFEPIIKSPKKVFKAKEEDQQTLFNKVQFQNQQIQLRNDVLLKELEDNRVQIDQTRSYYQQCLLQKQSEIDNLKIENISLKVTIKELDHQKKESSTILQQLHIEQQQYNKLRSQSQSPVVNSKSFAFGQSQEYSGQQVQKLIQNVVEEAMKQQGQLTQRIKQSLNQCDAQLSNLEFNVQQIKNNQDTQRQCDSVRKMNSSEIITELQGEKDNLLIKLKIQQEKIKKIDQLNAQMNKHMTTSQMDLEIKEKDIQQNVIKLFKPLISNIKSEQILTLEEIHYQIEYQLQQQDQGLISYQNLLNEQQIQMEEAQNHQSELQQEFEKLNQNFNKCKLENSKLKHALKELSDKHKEVQTAHEKSLINQVLQQQDQDFKQKQLDQKEQTQKIEQLISQVKKLEQQIIKLNQQNQQEQAQKLDLMSNHKKELEQQFLNFNQVKQQDSAKKNLETNNQILKLEEQLQVSQQKSQTQHEQTQKIEQANQQILHLEEQLIKLRSQSLQFTELKQEADNHIQYLENLQQQQLEASQEQEYQIQQASSQIRQLELQLQEQKQQSQQEQSKLQERATQRENLQNLEKDQQIGDIINQIKLLEQQLQNKQEYTQDIQQANFQIKQLEEQLLNQKQQSLQISENHTEKNEQYNNQIKELEQQLRKSQSFSEQQSEFSKKSLIQAHELQCIDLQDQLDQLTQKSKTLSDKLQLKDLENSQSLEFSQQQQMDFELQLQEVKQNLILAEQDITSLNEKIQQNQKEQQQNYHKSLSQIQLDLDDKIQQIVQMQEAENQLYQDKTRQDIQINELMSERDQINQKFRDSISQNEILQSLHEGENKSYQELKDEADQQQYKIQHTEKELQMLKEQLQHENFSLEEVQNERNLLLGQLESERSQMNEIQLKNDNQLKANCEVNRIQSESVQQMLIDAQRQVQIRENLESSIEQRDLDVINLNKQISSLEDEINDLNSSAILKQSDYDKSLQNLQDKDQELFKDKDEQHKNEIQLLQVELQTASDIFKDVHNQALQSSDRNNDLNEIISNLEEQIQSSQIQIENLEQQKLEARSQQDMDLSKFQDLNKMVEIYKIEIQDQVKQISDLKTINLNQETELDVQLLKINEKQQQILLQEIQIQTQLRLHEQNIHIASQEQDLLTVDENQIQTLQIEVTQGKELIDSQCFQLWSLQTELNNLRQSQENQKHSQQDQFNVQLQEKNKDNAQLEQKIEQLQHELEMSEKNKSFQQQMLLKLQEDEDSLNNQIQQLEQQLEDAVKDKMVEIEKYNALENVVDKLQLKNQELNQILQDLTNNQAINANDQRIELKKEQERYDELNKSQDTYLQLIQSQNEQLDQKNKEIGMLTSEIEQMNKYQEQNKSNQNQQIIILQQECQDLNDQLEGIRQEQKIIEQKKIQMEDSLGSVEEIKLYLQKTEKTQEVEDLGNRLQDQTKLVEKLRAENNFLQNIIETKSHRSLHSKLNESQQLAQFEDFVTLSENQSQQDKNEMSELQDLLELRQQDPSFLRQELEKIKLDKADLEEEFKFIVEQNKMLIQEVEMLKDQINNTQYSDQQNDGLMEQLNNAQNQIQNMQQQIDDNESLLQDSKEKLSKSERLVLQQIKDKSLQMGEFEIQRSISEEKQNQAQSQYKLDKEQQYLSLQNLDESQSQFQQLKDLIVQFLQFIIDNKRDQAKTLLTIMSKIIGSQQSEEIIEIVFPPKYFKKKDKGILGGLFQK